MRDRGRRPALALLLALAACSGATAGDPPAAGDCVVATIDGHAVTTAHVEALRAQLDPAPGPDAAARYAIEAALARWDGHGDLAGATIREQIAAHEQVLLRARSEGGDPREVASRARERLREAARRADLRPGPCHPGDPPAPR